LGPPDKKPKWLELRWPKALRNIWLQNISFLLLALFSSVLLTSPNVTFIVLAAMLFAAVGLSMIFRRRAFCRYLCPVGGFIGLYSQAAPLELRVKEKAAWQTLLQRLGVRLRLSVGCVPSGPYKKFILRTVPRMPSHLPAG
jgi:polyferredoxin